LVARGAAELRVLDASLEALVAHDVGPRVEEEAIARETVAAGAPDLLVPALDRAWHLAVDHVADVRLVDAHAERDRRDDHVDLVARERVLVARADVVVQARVIRHGADAAAAEEIGERLDVLPA